MSEPSSPRLRFRRVDEVNQSQLWRLATDDHVRRYLLDGERVPERWGADERRRSDGLFESHGVGLWLLYPRDDGAASSPGAGPVGFAGFRVFDELSPEPQLLYALLRENTGRGLATEVAAALLELTSLGAWPRVLSGYDAPNVASGRVLSKVGFRPAGRIPGAFGDILLVERRATPGEPLADAQRALATQQELRIGTLWNGAMAGRDEAVTMRLQLRRDELVVEIEAPYHGDAAPPGALGPGPTDALWEHEVVELMLLGDDERYLEVELSPHGHYLALQLQGPRRTIHSGLHLGARSAIHGHRWQGRAKIPSCWLPPGLSRLNAFAMHGVGPTRRYLCWRAARNPGPRPDFHRLEAFGALSAL